MIDLSTIALVLIVTAILAALLRFRTGQRWRVRHSKKVLRRLRAIDSPQQLFSYMRKLDPYLFEELLLTCFEEHGLVVKRNCRYSGDGGSDGEVYLGNRMMHVQAKRYQSHIKKAHVEEFLRLVTLDGTKGIFAHTGRTGKHSRALFLSDSIDCLSGARLVALIRGEAVHLHGVHLASIRSASR